MNKTSKLLLGLAALALGACSNDEPVKQVPGSAGTPAQGDIAYLNIRINADGGSRADETNYIYGDNVENNVKNAYFYFYDNEGNFVTESNSWVNKENGTNENVEIIGNNTVILTGLTDKKYPNWVVTVLNRPDNFTPPHTLSDWANATANFENVRETEREFVMTTTSFFNAGDAANYVADAKDYKYFATPLVEANFLQETPDKVKFDENSRVQIYVERLAARVGVRIAITNEANPKLENTKYKDGDNEYDLYRLDVTIAGATNPDEENNSTAATDVYVAITGWKLATTAKTSNMVKNLADWNSTTQIGSWADWNNDNYHRSYWGKATTYGLAGAALLEKLNENKDLYADLNLTVADAKFAGSRAYCNENTNLLANICDNNSAENKVVSPKYATNVVLRAVICDKDGNPVSTVHYLGVNWTREGFLNKVLDLIKPNVYTREEDKIVKDKDDNDVQLYKYTQITAKDLYLVEAPGTGAVNVCLRTKDDNGVAYPTDKYWKVIKQELVEWDTVDTEAGTGSKGSYTNTIAEVVNVADVNEALAKATAGTSNKATVATNGAMYYSLPIQHLNPVKTEEGAYGVVRNHVYDISITKINSLGNFVFAPTEIKENGEIVKPEPIVPEDPKDPTYYVESNVNILSWKIVSSNYEI